MAGHDDQDHDHDRGLRAQRPEARDEFVQHVAAAVRGRRHSSPRFGLAFAFSLAILVSLVAFGGVGAASNALHASAAAVRSAVGDDNGKGRDVEQGKPSHDQTHGKVFICLPKHHKYHTHYKRQKALAYVTQRVSSRSVPSLVSKGAIYPVPAGGCSSLNGQTTATDA